MTTYYCSDPHAFHGNILKYSRRLAFMTEADREAFLALEADGDDARSLRISDESIDNMNRGLVANVNARVGPNDTLWCLGDWCFGRGGDYLRNARWFRDQIQCRTVHLVWGNHDDKKIRDLFSSTHEQVEIRDGGVRLTLNHYPMLTWNGQHHATVAEPNVHLYGHVHALYQKDPDAGPLKDAAAWPALDVGFDGHDYQVWSLEEILECLHPRLAAFEALKRSRHSNPTCSGVEESKSITNAGQSAGWFGLEPSEDPMSPFRFLTLSRHHFPGGSGDGSNDPSDTSQHEGDAGPVGVLPKENISKSCPQTGSEQGQANDSCNDSHDQVTLFKRFVDEVWTIDFAMQSVTLVAAIPAVKPRSFASQYVSPARGQLVSADPVPARNLFRPSHSSQVATHNQERPAWTFVLSPRFCLLAWESFGSPSPSGRCNGDSGSTSVSSGSVGGPGMRCSAFKSSSSPPSSTSSRQRTSSKRKKTILRLTATILRRSRMTSR